MSDARGFHRAVPSDEPAGSAGATISAVVIAGIVCAAVVVAGLMAPLVYWLYRRKRKVARAHDHEQQQVPASPLHPPAAVVTPLVCTQQTGASAAAGGQGDDTWGRAQDAEGIAEHSVAVAGRDDNGLCGMCRSAYDAVRGGGELPETLECGHRFHRRCVRRWVRVNLACPTCNATHIQLCGEADGESSIPSQRQTASLVLGIDPSGRDELSIGIGSWSSRF